jgi:hypothetical protein
MLVAISFFSASHVGLGTQTDAAYIDMIKFVDFVGYYLRVLMAHMLEQEKTQLLQEMPSCSSTPQLHAQAVVDRLSADGTSLEEKNRVVRSLGADAMMEVGIF